MIASEMKITSFGHPVGSPVMQIRLFLQEQYQDHDFCLKTKIKTKTMLFVLEILRDQDFVMEDNHGRRQAWARGGHLSPPWKCANGYLKPQSGISNCICCRPNCLSRISGILPTYLKVKNVHEFHIQFHFYCHYKTKRF